MWGYDNGGSSRSVRWNLPRPSAFSEPENQNMRDFCEEHEFRLALNYHSYANLLLSPWGYIPTCAPMILSFKHSVKSHLWEWLWIRSRKHHHLSYQWRFRWLDVREQTPKTDLFLYSWSRRRRCRLLAPVSMIIPLCQANMWQNIMLAKLGDHGPLWETLPGILEIIPAFCFRCNPDRIGRRSYLYGEHWTLNDAIDSISPPFLSLILKSLKQVVSIHLLSQEISRAVMRLIICSSWTWPDHFTTPSTKFTAHRWFVFEDSASTSRNGPPPSGTLLITSIIHWKFHYDSHSVSTTITKPTHHSQWSHRPERALYAVLNFWTIWDIEPGYDYVQVFISDDNGSTWTRWKGSTRPGHRKPGPDNLYTMAPRKPGEGRDQPGRILDKEIRSVSGEERFLCGSRWILLDDMTVMVIDVATTVGPQNFVALQSVTLHPTCNRSYYRGLPDKKSQGWFKVCGLWLAGQKVMDLPMEENSISTFPPGLQDVFL